MGPMPKLFAVNSRTFCLLVLLVAFCFGGQSVASGTGPRRRTLVLPSQRRPTHDRLAHAAAPGVTATSVPSSAVAGPSMLLINVLTFLFYGTLGSVMPFLPLFYRRLGISDAHIGFLGAITPTISIFVSPLWGMLADITQQHKFIMLLTFFGSIILRALYYFLPAFFTSASSSSSFSHLLLLALLVALTATLYAPVKPLLDSAILNQLPNKTDYGKTRLYGQLGFGFGSFLAGPWLTNDIAKIFLLQLLLAVPTAGLMTCLIPNVNIPPATEAAMKPRREGGEERTEKTGKLMAEKSLNRENEENNDKLNINKQIKHKRMTPNHSLTNPIPQPVMTSPRQILTLLSQNLSFVFFLFVVFLIGVSSGIMENFAYVRLTEIGGDSQVLGSLRLLSSISGGPMFYWSSTLLRWWGIHLIMLLSIGSYLLRFFVYAHVATAWDAWPAELLRGTTFALFWSAATYYVYTFSPVGYTATMLGLLNGVYGGLGQSTGAVVGGMLSHRMTIQKTFHLCGIVEIFVLLAYGLGQCFLTPAPAADHSPQPHQAHHHTPTPQKPRFGKVWETTQRKLVQSFQMFRRKQKNKLNEKNASGH